MCKLPFASYPYLNFLGGEKMDQLKLETIAELMSKQSSEQVDVANIVKLPYNGEQNSMRNDRYDVYVARSESYTCLLYSYADGRVHVYVH